MPPFQPACELQAIAGACIGGALLSTTRWDLLAQQSVRWIESELKREQDVNNGYLQSPEGVVPL